MSYQQHTTGDLILDIETAAPEWHELQDRTRTYLLDRSVKALAREHNTSPDEISRDVAEARAADRLALEMGLAQVVAIGIWDNSKSCATILLNAPETKADFAGDGTHNVTTIRAGEAEILRAFWRGVERRSRRLVTFNGRNYDGPVLMIRSAQLGVECSRDLVPYRYDLASHCDLADALSFYGAKWGGYDLEYWCMQFGIHSPKGDISGGDVGRLWREGKFVEIGEYLLGDLLATRNLYEALKPMLCVFKSGPVNPSHNDDTQSPFEDPPAPAEQLPLAPVEDATTAEPASV